MRRIFTREEVEHFIVSWLEKWLRRNMQDEKDVEIFHVLDSLGIVVFLSDLEKWLGKSLPWNFLLECNTINEIVNFIIREY